MSRAARAMVVDLAAALFADRGFSSTSMRAIADVAGVTEAVLYRTFGSKDGLLAAMAEPLLDDLDQVIDTVWLDLTLEEERAALLQSYVGAVLRHRSVARVVLADSGVQRSATWARVVAQQRSLGARLVGPRPKLDEQVRARCALAIARLSATELASVPADRLRESIVRATLECMHLGSVPGARVARSRTASAALSPG